MGDVCRRGEIIREAELGKRELEDGIKDIEATEGERDEGRDVDLVLVIQHLCYSAECTRDTDDHKERRSQEKAVHEGSAWLEEETARCVFRSL